MTSRRAGEWKIRRFLFLALYTLLLQRSVESSSSAFSALGNALRRNRMASKLFRLSTSSKSHEEQSVVSVPTRPTAEDDAEAYNAITSAAVVLSDAHVNHGILSVTRTVRDIDQGKKRKYQFHIPIPVGQGFFPFSIPPTEWDDEVKARVQSPSGDKVAILREENDQKGKNGRQVMEIWTNFGQSLSQRIIVPTDQHGKIINDPAGFGTLQWNPDETAVVYAAERKVPKNVRSFFEKSTTADGNGEDEKVVGGEYTQGLGKSETWGEKYTTISGSLDLFILAIETEKVGRVQNVPGGDFDPLDSSGGSTLGQAVFSPCGTHLVYTAWDAGAGGQMPRRLGLIYCLNRPSKICMSNVTKLVESLLNSAEDDTDAMSIMSSPSAAVSTARKHFGLTEKLDEGFTCLTPDSMLSRSPRFSPVKNRLSRLCFLSNKPGFDTHYGCFGLHSIYWDTQEKKPNLENYQILMDQLADPQPLDDNNSVQVGNMGFPGLYVSDLPANCCTSEFLLTTTQWGSVQKVVRISLADGHVSLVNVDIIRSNGGSTERNASQQLLCVTAEGGAVFSESAPNRPSVVAYVQPELLARDNVARKVEATLVSEMGPIAASSFSPTIESDVMKRLNFSYDVLAMRPPQFKDTVDTQVQWVLLRPRARFDGKKPALIVVPHGGPHSCTPTSFIPSYAFLCAHGGYAILHVNYRGSTGFGQNALEALPGNIGTLDVKDVVHAAVTLSESGWIDPDRIGVCGGSHGGFLASHLIGQYPDMFKVAAMRNPVTNIASMVTATDIPDWCYVETMGCGYIKPEEFRAPYKEELGVMYDMSPIKHVSKVQAPTLVALGMSDQRVPPSQGLEFYHAIRARGVKTKLLTYDDDDHAIDKPKSEADHWINIKRWFDEHL